MILNYTFHLQQNLIFKALKQNFLKLQILIFCNRNIYNNVSEGLEVLSPKSML